MRKLLNTFHKFFSIHSEFTGTHSGSFFEVNKTLKKCKTVARYLCC